MTPEELHELDKVHHTKTAEGKLITGSFGIGSGGLDLKAALAWTAVGIPICLGLWITITKTAVLFR